MDQILNILGSLGFNWHVALANFINFLIILFILNKFFFGKIGKVIKHRHGVIERGISDASDAEKSLANAEEEKKKIVKEAHKESRDILATAETNAQAIASNIRKEAELEANNRMQELHLKEQNLKENVEKSFAEQAPELVAKLYAKTLAKEMTEVENNAFISKMNA
ncbi:MAG: hypothetical protein WCT07_00350 [Candidatus Paceibacterota bacterium]|jgi:F-type H+-transporting ATPase subunit b